MPLVLDRLTVYGQISVLDWMGYRCRMWKDMRGEDVVASFAWKFKNSTTLLLLSRGISRVRQVWRDIFLIV